jgi:4-hydroxy 2-oxovalerate aldolase
LLGKSDKRVLSGMKNIKLLDCTLRDGGQLLEAHNSELQFSLANCINTARLLSEANIDVIELGFINTSDKDFRDIALFPAIESISGIIPEERKKGQLFSALFPDPDYPIEKIPEYSDSYCDVIRVILRYSELQKSLDFFKQISRKGYKIFIQPMVTTRYAKDELLLLLSAANEMAAYAVYFVDSYGYMGKQDVVDYYTLFDKNLEDSIYIGFHAHNNINLAFSNALAFIECQTDRNIILDSCLIGMGQGSGNLQTEIMADYLNKNHDAMYDYDAILRGCEIIEQLWTQNIWGYSVARLLSAINKTAYKFSECLRETYKLPFVEIHHILKSIPEDMRHRYTIENVRNLLKLNGYADCYIGND